VPDQSREVHDSHAVDVPVHGDVPLQPLPRHRRHRHFLRKVSNADNGNQMQTLSRPRCSFAGAQLLLGIYDFDVKIVDT
jgi:hypothetical protein